MYNEIKNISPELHNLSKNLRKILTPSPPRGSARRITMFTRKYIDTLQWNNTNDNSSSESLDSFKGRFHAYRELIKSYFGSNDNYMHISQLTDDGIDFLMDLASSENNSHLYLSNSAITGKMK